MGWIVEQASVEVQDLRLSDRKIFSMSDLRKAPRGGKVCIIQLTGRRCILTQDNPVPDQAAMHMRSGAFRFAMQFGDDALRFALVPQEVLQFVLQFGPSPCRHGYPCGDGYPCGQGWSLPLLVVKLQAADPV